MMHLHELVLLKKEKKKEKEKKRKLIEAAGCFLFIIYMVVIRGSYACLFILIFMFVSTLFKHAVLGTHLSYFGCLSRTVS